MAVVVEAAGEAGEVAMEVAVGPQTKGEDKPTEEGRPGGDYDDGYGDVHGYGDVRVCVSACGSRRGRTNPPSGYLGHPAAE